MWRWIAGYTEGRGAQESDIAVEKYSSCRRAREADCYQELLVILYVLVLHFASFQGDEPRLCSEYSPEEDSPFRRIGGGRIRRFYQLKSS